MFSPFAGGYLPPKPKNFKLTHLPSKPPKSLGGWEADWFCFSFSPFGWWTTKGQPWKMANWTFSKAHDFGALQPR